MYRPDISAIGLGVAAGLYAACPAPRHTTLVATHDAPHHGTKRTAWLTMERELWLDILTSR